LLCSASVDKGIVSAMMDGCDVGGVVRCESLVNVTPPCLDVEVFSEEEPIPLSYCPPFTKKKSSVTKSSAWVLQTVKEIRHVLRLFVQGF
jgi:hypothetical protein